MKVTTLLKHAATCATLVLASAAEATPADGVRMTWFGITNWHYQIGTTGILLDGETLSDFQHPVPDATSVAKAYRTLRRQGSVDAILVGHEHADHAVQVPEWARQTGKPVYAPAPVCAKVVQYGLPPERCTVLKGGETLALSADVTVRVVRWVHSVAGCSAHGHGTNEPETFGFLISTRTPARSAEPLQLFVSDSGAGGDDLTTPRVAAGVTYGSPMDNLKAALADAHADAIDLWQGGPESRVVTQARLLVPAFHIKAFMPHHLGVRPNSVSSFKLEYGLHFPYDTDEQPLLRDYLTRVGVPQLVPVNYWDAWQLDARGVTRLDNADQKADYGLPPSGPGPGRQGENPRLGQLECRGD